MARPTVDRYLDLLEQIFVIFRLPSFSTNPHKEVAKSQKRQTTPGTGALESPCLPPAPFASSSARPLTDGWRLARGSAVTE